MTSPSPHDSVVPLRVTMAEEIRALLARKRISGVRLATAIGKSQSYVSRRLTGETPFDVDDLEGIARVLGVDITAFLPRPDVDRSAPFGGQRVVATGGVRDATNGYARAGRARTALSEHPAAPGRPPLDRRPRATPRRIAIS